MASFYEEDPLPNRGYPVTNSHASSTSWHPKISPYRLFIISSGISLSTVKLVSSRNGDMALSTTLEWISGPFLFLLIFGLSAYDSKEDDDIPDGLSWLFKPDCMNIIWHILAVLSIRRPAYTSREIFFISQPYLRHLPLTVYRVLVCLSVISFGLLKATFTYLGFSTAMTWIDWVQAVPFATVLYCLGLYEYNDSNIWPSFFVVDQRGALISLKRSLKYLLSIALSMAWIFYFWYMLSLVWRDPSPFANSTLIHGDGSSKGLLRTQLDRFYDLSCKLILEELLVVFIAGGLAVLFLVLDAATLAISTSGPFRRPFRERFIPIPKFATSFVEWVIMSIITLFVFCVHLSVHLFGILPPITGSHCLQFPVSEVGYTCLWERRCPSVF
ncbi:hypothetical protein GALMADRAFT_253773 [Galerina marginata CBS 339.88]|uniref:Uncharacterized protein n=1 Tax=Galerina marginata (strain CBS 339.88) TaxID=685588 RepID=A0A067SXL1_GALM3|nr:hypothetical protein GALMADRAFT_253773 [Galerina marginata CBS 339.88]